MGVTAVVDGYQDYVKQVGGMAKATEASHSRLAALGSIALKGTVAGVGAVVASVTAVGVAAAASTIKITQMAASLAIDTAPLVDQEAAFFRLAEARGKSGADILAQMTEETAGTVAQTDLIALYNKGIALMGERFFDVIPIMGEVVSQGAALGRSPVEAIEDFSIGVGRGSRLILDNLGIIVDLEGANKAMAKSLGKTTLELTEGEQQAALLNAATERLLLTAGDLPTIAETSAGAFSFLKASLANTRFEIGKSLLPTVVALAKELGEGLGTALPEIVQIVRDEFLPYFRNLGATLGTVLPRAIRWGVTAFQFFMRLIGRIGDFLREWIVPGFNFLGRVLDRLWPVLDTITKKFGEFYSAWADAGPLSAEFAQAVASLFPPWVGETIEAVRTKLLEWYETARTWWEEKAPLFKQAFADVRDYIVNEFIPNALDWLKEKFGPVGEAAKTMFAAFIDDIPLVVSEWEKIKTRAQLIFGESIPEWLDGLGVTFENLGEIAGAVLTFLTGQWEAHGDGVIGTISKIIQFGLEALSFAVLASQKIFNIALEAITGDFDNVIRIVGELEQVIADFIEGIFGQTAGKEGILPKEWLDSLVEWGEGVRSFFGIKSPSTFMADIGQNIVRGFEKGLALGNSPISAAVAPTPATVAAGAGAISNFNLTVNTASPREPIIGDFRMMAALSRR
jgi:hypothetical protein